MAYQSRKRDYLTRREKNAKTWRNAKMITLFVFLAAIVWIIKDWEDVSFWMKTYLKG